MASATNGMDDRGSGSIHDLQQPLSISAIILRFFCMSPALRLFMLGISPGLRTMYAINSVGSPPIGKNSSPDLRTKVSKTLCVARRTLCPCAWSSFPSAIKGCTSPRLPTTCMTILSLCGKGGGCAAWNSEYDGGGPRSSFLSSKPCDGAAIDFRLIKDTYLTIDELRSTSRRPSAVKYQTSRFLMTKEILESDL